MTQAIDPNALIMGSGAKSALFKVHGDQVWGAIMSSEVRQQTDFDTGALMFWDDGKPRMQVVILLLTEEQDDDDDDGMRAVYARGQMLKAIRAAVVKAGANGIADGGKLVIRYTGDAEPKRKGMSGAKQFFAKYEPPVSVTHLPEDTPAYDGSDEDSLPF